jgi:hypothetical protein
VIPRRALAVLALTASLAGGLPGCENSSDRNRPAARQGFDPSAPWRGYPSRDPANTVLSYWRLIQLGAYPAAVAGYDPAVVNAVTSSMFLDTIAAQRLGVASMKPRVTDVRDVGNAKIIAVDGRNSKGGGGAFSFLLRKQGDVWILAYDSLLGDSMESSLVRLVLRGNGSGAGPRVRSRSAAAAAAERYRDAGLKALGAGRIGAAPLGPQRSARR